MSCMRTGREGGAWPRLVVVGAREARPACTMRTHVDQVGHYACAARTCTAAYAKGWVPTSIPSFTADCSNHTYIHFSSHHWSSQPLLQPSQPSTAHCLPIEQRSVSCPMYHLMHHHLPGTTPAPLPLPPERSKPPWGPYSTIPHTHAARSHTCASWAGSAYSPSPSCAAPPTLPGLPPDLADVVSGVEQEEAAKLVAWAMGPLLDPASPHEPPPMNGERHCCASLLGGPATAAPAATTTSGAALGALAGPGPGAAGELLVLARGEGPARCSGVPLAPAMERRGPCRVVNAHDKCDTELARRFNVVSRAPTGMMQAQAQGRGVCLGAAHVCVEPGAAHLCQGQKAGGARRHTDSGALVHPPIMAPNRAGHTRCGLTCLQAPLARCPLRSRPKATGRQASQQLRTCTLDRMLLPPWASVWPLSAEAATPTKMLTGAAPKLSSWTCSEAGAHSHGARA